MIKIDEHFRKEIEFEEICKEFIFPLIGVSFGGLKATKRKHTLNKLVEYESGTNSLFMYESLDGNHCYKIQVSNAFPKETVSLINTVLGQLLDYSYFNPKTKQTYKSYLQLLNQFGFVTQRSVIKWLTGDHKNSENIELLIKHLEDWKEKTYEGKNVSFAFVVRLDSLEKGTISFDEFLSEEYSATFSDGITSVINLDQNLRFLSYCSITSLKNISHNYNVGPIRFSDVINNFMDDGIGVILLSNGDIILVKNKSICLVKREGRWLNFSKSVFASVMAALLKDDNNRYKTLIEEIYLSALDVSFSHSGGIIAFILNQNIDKIIQPNNYEKLINCELIDTKSLPILDYLDNFDIQLLDYDELVKKNSEEFGSAKFKKRYNKRLFLLSVIDGKRFEEIDRRLRVELISMDGATIIKENGELLSVGAIIQNESGSYGGGRGAAARKLSNYGFAIKISTDGYIECYKGGDIAFKIK